MNRFLSAAEAIRRFKIAVVIISLTHIPTLAWGEESQTAPNNLVLLGQSVMSKELELGQDIYAQYCASCHGKKLEGQPNWKRRLNTGRMPAPPHDKSGHTWAHSDQELFEMTKFSIDAVIPGYESDMPAFTGILSDQQIIAVLAYIKSQWPAELQTKQDKLNK
ncbi:cytochrome c [Photobacterium sp. CAU 1568]|uniref:Cytochrome c n=2 Tax=Photobacterium arenosum TaxID=2774143 RepID=A0ABR9BNP5_9GAMM|nr:cytochrome c [Photobacterium arenosum]